MPRPLTIAVLSAGNSIHTVRWVNAFAQRGHVVHLITLHPTIEGLSDHVTVHELPLFGGAGYVLNATRLKRILKRIKPNVLNVHYATGYGSLARSCNGWPIVMNVWGSDVLDFPQKSAMHRQLVKSNLGKADRVVSTSRSMAKQVSALMDGAKEPEVVPFGVDVNEFSSRPVLRSDGMITLGTIKKLEPVYGVDRLMKAFISLCELNDLPEIRLRLVGAGDGRKELEEMAGTAGVQEWVEFVGEVGHAQVPSELNKLDIYVALSRSESFGVAVVEASACELPVVVSDVGGLPEVVAHESTGLVVPGDDQAAIVDALARLVRDADLRSRLGKAGREKVLAEFEWEHCVDRMMMVLQKTANASEG